MNIFSGLLLGHLLGDWLLQSDWMAIGKRQGLFTWAGMSHFMLYTLSILAALWLFGGAPLTPGLWLVIAAAIFISHWLVDSTNIVQGWMRLVKQRDQPMVRLMVDQTLHLIVLGLVAKFLYESV